MRVMLRAAATGLACIAVVGTAARAQGVKLAYVNVDALLPNVPGYAAAESLYTKEAASWDSQIKAKADSLQQMQDSYNKALPTMANDSVRSARQKPIQDYYNAAQAFKTKLDQTAQQRQIALMSPIQETLQKVLDDFRMENGYAFIFRVSSDAPAVFVSADKNLDVTDKILIRLKALPAKAPPATGPAGLKRPPTK